MTIKSSPQPANTDKANSGDGKDAPISGQLLGMGRADADTVLHQLASRLDGLTQAEADARLKQYGLNTIAREQRLPFLPMLPIQVLINNLLYDFSQTTIPTDEVDADWLIKPRKWEIGEIQRFILFIGPISSVFDYLTFFIM